MLKAREVMTKDVLCATPDLSLEDAVDILLYNKISGMPVCDGEGIVLGMISERDILNFVFSGNLKTTLVREAMSTKIVSFSPEADIDVISLTMGEKKLRRVPIVENGKLLGIISRRSILRSVLSKPVYK